MPLENEGYDWRSAAEAMWGSALMALEEGDFHEARSKAVMASHCLVSAINSRDKTVFSRPQMFLSLN